MVIKLIVLDIDGVMTDGTFFVNEKGKEMKHIFLRDVDAYFRLKRKGYKIGFITGEDTEIVHYFQKRFTPDFLIRGCKDKAKELKKLVARYKITLDEVAYCGDGLSDILAMEISGFSFAPKNSYKGAINKAKIVLEKEGGKGAIEALEEAIYQIENKRKK